MWRNVIICLMLVVVTYVVYEPMRRAELINFDDPGYVGENQHVQAGLMPGGGLDNIGWALTTPSEFNWHPLTWMSYMLDNDVYTWFLRAFPNQSLIVGMPGGFHLTSVLLHVANSVLLFLVLLRMTKIRWASAVVAVIFALHPQHVESVAWVSERKDVLSGLFWILTMGVYALYVERKDWTRFLFYGLVLLCTALGLMAKPMVVTLPFVLLLLDVWPLGRLSFGGGQEPGEVLDIDDIRLQGEDASSENPSGNGVPKWVWILLEKAPLFAMIVASSIVTYIVQQEGGAMTYAQRCPTEARLMNMPISYIAYLFKAFVPIHLAVFYPYNHEPLWWQTGGALAILGTITGLVIWQLRRRPYLAVGWFWFLGTLVPVIGLVQVGAQAMADRYTYIPTLGLLLAAVFGIREAVIRYRAEAMGFVPVTLTAVLVSLLAVALWITSAGWLAVDENAAWVAANATWVSRVVAPAGAVLILLSFAAVAGLVWWRDRLLALLPLALGAVAALVGLTVIQVAYWQNTKVLFMHALEVEPHNAVAHCNLGESMFLRGQYADAEIHFRAALAIDDEQTGAHNNLGWSLARRGLIQEAIQHYKRSLEIDPKNAAAHNNYALALAQTGHTQEAIDHLNEALKLEKDYGAAHNNLGMILAERGQLPEAEAHYREAVRINRKDLVARANLGMVLSNQGKVAEALEMLQSAIELDRTYPAAHNNLGLVFCRIGKYREAVEEYAEALRLDPNQPGTRNNLGMALAQLNQTPEAIAQFREALRLDSKQPDARMNLAQVLRKEGKVEEAMQVLRDGIAMRDDWAQPKTMLAWILATDARYIKPDEALTLATRACELTHRQDPQALDTLAAALAANGRFAEAVVTEQEALERARAVRPDMVQVIQARIALYQSGKPLWQMP